MKVDSLYLDSEGFVLRSDIFAGNASEPKTLAQMISGFSHCVTVHVPIKKEFALQLKLKENMAHKIRL